MKHLRTGGRSDEEDGDMLPACRHGGLLARCALMILSSWLLASLAMIPVSADSRPAQAPDDSYEDPDILFISSYSLDWYEVPRQITGLQNALGSSADLQYIFMDTKHVSISEAEQNAYLHLKSLCSQKEFDAVVAGDDAALDFTLKHREELLSGIPLVFMGINSIEKAEQAAQEPLCAGTAELFPLKETVSLAESLYPQAGRVVALTDGTVSSDGYLSQLNAIRDQFPKLAFEEMDCSELTRQEITDRISAMDERTILICMIMSRDGSGNFYSVSQAAEFLSSVSAIPIFRADESGIGDGFFGGCVISYQQMGEQAGRIVRQMLIDPSAAEKDVTAAETYFEFDNQKLRQFQIPGSRLPWNRMIINGPGTYLVQNRQLLISAGIIIGILVLTMILFAIDGRKQEVLQKKLRKSQELYRTAVNAADLVIWEYDPQTHVITMSFSSDFTKYVCGVRGFPQVLEDGPARQAAVIDEECRQDLLGMYRQIDEGAEAAECRYGFQWGNGHCYRHARATAVYDDRHHRTAVCISVDVTIEQQMKELYEKELQYLHQTNESALTSKGHHDLTDGRILEYSILSRPDIVIPEGMTYQQMLERSLSGMIRKEDRAALAAIADQKTLIRRYYEGERHFSYKFRRTKVDQAPGWAELQFNTFLSPVTGHIECFVYTYDVTEQELQNQIIAKLVEFGYENMGFIYPDTHAATVFVLNEPRAQKKYISTMDYDTLLEKVLSKSVNGNNHELLQALCVQTVTEHLASGAPYVYAVSTEEADHQSRRRQFAFSWLSDRHETIFFCVSDITRQYETAQRQIQELSEARLAAVRANEAKSAFLSSMSHDLRTPLNGILGFTGIALAENDPARKQDYLKKISLSGELLLSLVNDTLDLSRIESGKMTLEPEAFDGRELAEALLAAVNPSAELKNIHLIADTDRFPEGILRADKLKLQKILLNLLSNAIKYTPPGGTVRFSIDAIDSPGSRMTRRFMVEDNGIGMKEEFLPRLYEPFAQEKRPEAANIQGTGLGLSIVKRIVDLMNGTIEVRSEVNRGTTFIVELPLECMGQEDGRNRKSEGTDAILSGKQILLAEDNQLNAEIASLLLKEKGMKSVWVENGKQALDQFSMTKAGTFDAILMDIRMPVMDGWQAAEAIRALKRPDSRTIPIIAMTAEAFEEDMKHAKEIGMNDYLSKPIDPARLYAALSAQLEKT